MSHDCGLDSLPLRAFINDWIEMKRQSGLDPNFDLVLVSSLGCVFTSSSGSFCAGSAPFKLPVYQFGFLVWFFHVSTTFYIVDTN